MEITEVRIKLMEEPNDRLQAFCSITLDGSFVIRDLKIIQGSRGSFVAMPSRKLNDRCPRCGSKNELRAGYCSQCGNKLNQERALRDQSGRAKLYADIAHPINTECREMIQEKVLAAFEEELVKAQQPDYICRYDDYGESNFAEEAEPQDSPAQRDILPLHGSGSSSAPSSSAPPSNAGSDEPDAPMENKAPAHDSPGQATTSSESQAPAPSIAGPVEVEEGRSRRFEKAESEPTGPHQPSGPQRVRQTTGDDDAFGVGID